MRAQADVSGGGTDLTWSLTPSIAYGFGDSEQFAITAGYRRMDIDFKATGPVDSKMRLSGLLLGLRTSF